MATPPPSFVELVAALDGLGIRLWRWPNDSLGAWPPAPWPLSLCVRAHKPALLDLVDARAARGDVRIPAWARSPDPEGWISTPGDEQVRFPPGGGHEIRLTPEAQAALEARLAAQAARWEALAPEERARLAEACLSDDVKLLFPHGLPDAGAWEL